MRAVDLMYLCASIVAGWYWFDIMGLFHQLSDKCLMDYMCVYVCVCVGVYVCGYVCVGVYMCGCMCM